MASNDNGEILAIGAANMVTSSRTLKSGATRQRVKITISGDTLLVNTDPKSLGKGPADAIAALVQERLGGVASIASPGTLAYREQAAKAFALGKRWAVKRYGGGKMGAMQPNASPRALNDSGRLTKSIAVGATKDGYTVNVAANRLDPSTVRGGMVGVERIWGMIKLAVPELADLSRMLDSLPVRRAIEQGIADSVVRVQAQTEAAVAAGVQSARALMMARVNLAKQIFSALSGAL